MLDIFKHKSKLNDLQEYIEHQYHYSAERAATHRLTKKGDYYEGQAVALANILIYIDDLQGFIPRSWYKEGGE